MDTPTCHEDFDVHSISSSTSDGPCGLHGVLATSLKGKNTREEWPGTGMMCEVKNLWEGKKKCPCCVNWVEEYPQDIQPNPEETEAVQQYALIVRYRKSHGSIGKAMTLSSIVVQSPLLKPLLEEVFEGYAGITATLKRVTFSAPFAPFFYRWRPFKRAVEEVEDGATSAHAKLLYDVLFKELDETISTYHDLLSHGVITWKHLWTLYKPGDLLLCTLQGEEMIMKLQSSEMDSGGFCLHAKYVEYNGSTFGYASHDFHIYTFEGTKSITDLDAYPIQFNAECAEIENRLLIRGKKFEDLQGCHYKMYKGYAELVPTTFGNRRVYTRNRTVDGRIMIHAEMYNRYNPGENFPLEPLEYTSFAPQLPVEPIHGRGPPPPPPPPPMPPMPPLPPMPNMPFMPPMPAPMPPPPVLQDQEPMSLSDELYPLCAPTIKGYSLKTKNWAKFKVDNVQEIVWDDRAFENLVLPPGHKELILSFTKNQNAYEGIVDDVIEGKGQGIVMLLNGEPGVGKTLTAESVAEHMRVPLYSMSAAQLGIASAEVEQALGDILEMTSQWKAILLLDETEVFLEQRTIDGLERNKLVSIFLRMLEYYRGVLFLTTNRVAVLDKALESRIHLKISYPELDREARARIWRNLIDMLPPSSIGLDPSDIDFLAERKMNGREIKNVIKAAQLLATGQEAPLNLEHIDTVLRITQIGGDFGAQV